MKYHSIWVHIGNPAQNGKIYTKKQIEKTCVRVFFYVCVCVEVQKRRGMVKGNGTRKKGRAGEQCTSNVKWGYIDASTDLHTHKQKVVTRGAKERKSLIITCGIVGKQI